MSRCWFATALTLWVGMMCLECKGAQVNVLAQNMKFIPTESAAITNLRADAMGKVLAAFEEGNEADRFDVFGFSETFMNEPTETMLSYLSESHPHTVVSQPRSLPSGKNLNSGLSIASRYPILVSDFHMFDASEGFDALAAKGVLAALIQVPPASYLVAVVTHQQAGGSLATYSAQLTEGREFIESFIGVNVPADAIGHTGVVFMGDFNINFLDETAPSDLYNEMLETVAHVATDPHVELNPDDSLGATFPAGEPRRRIDYLFYLDHVIEGSTCVFSNSSVTSISVNTLVASESIDGELLSDHLGVAATVQLGSRSSALDQYPFNGTSCSGEPLAQPSEENENNNNNHASTVQATALLASLLLSIIC